MPIFGDGDWGGPEEEQVRLAPSRGGALHSEYTARDTAYLAATIWGEARSEKALGMRAVAHVIMNRARSQRWGSSLEEVVRRRKQFSCWNSNDDNRAKINRMAQIDRYLKSQPEGYERWLAKFQRSDEYPEYLLWLQAKKIARDVVAGNTSDITDGALFYHTTAINPYWAPTMTPIKTIGNHTFLTDR
jgi:spore germination cell wall hydrolase CwlJ-like protein